MNITYLLGLSPSGVRFIEGEIRPRRAQFAALVVLSMIAGMIEMIGIGLVFPVLMVIVSPESIDRYSILVWASDTLGVGRGSGLYVLLTVLITLIMIAKSFYMIGFNWYQQRLLAEWKSVLSARLMRMYIYSEYRLYLEKTSSELIRNISLVSSVFDQFMTGVINLIVNSTIMVALAILLLIALPPETVFGLIPVCGAAAFFYFALKDRFQRIGEDMNSIFQARQAVIRQSIGLIRETKIMAKERYFLDRFRQVEEAGFQRNAYYNFLTTIPSLLIEAAVIVAILGLVSYILFRSGGHAVGLATLGLLAAALFRATPLLNRGLTALQLMNLSRNSVEIVATELEKLESAVKIPQKNDSRLPFERHLRLERVSYSYPEGKLPALREVSLDIRRKEFIGITGPSGSGKTTLGAIIMGLITPATGCVLVDEQPLDNADAVRGWQNHLGFVAQGAMLLEDTVAGNVAFAESPETVDRARAWKALETVQMKSFVESLPGQLDYFLGEDGIRLSGGQRQRLGIARALYRQPDVLLLDEATSALDVATEEAFTSTLLKLRGSRTLIVIAHRLSTLRGCDRVAMLSEGRLLDVAPFDQLEQRCPEFRRLVELSRLEQVA